MEKKTDVDMDIKYNKYWYRHIDVGIDPEWIQNKRTDIKEKDRNGDVEKEHMVVDIETSLWLQKKN